VADEILNKELPALLTVVAVIQGGATLFLVIKVYLE
jgi:hypothetical protein